MSDNSTNIPISSLLNAGAARPTRKLIILGASGSIGSTAIEFIRKGHGIELSGVSVHTSVDSLVKILTEFPVKCAAISDEGIFNKEKERLKREFPSVVFYGGEAGLVELIGDCQARGADTVLTAVVGACGVLSTMAALELSMKVALANKETLVTAGPAITKYLTDLLTNGQENRPVIIPVDSEHNAVFQLLNLLNRKHLQKVILTASGGPFRELPLDKLELVTREEVLDHPTWSMGPKISVDSAGMINKGLEIIEAHYLFSLPYEMIDVLIHKQSLVHSMLETRDGGYLLAASHPDMVFPIAHALRYPEAVQKRHSVATSPGLWAPVEFEDVSDERYPGFSLALEAAKIGGTATAIFNAANEVAVSFFLDGIIRFPEIASLVREALNRMEVEYGFELGLYLEADKKAREVAVECVESVRS